MFWLFSTLLKAAIASWLLVSCSSGDRLLQKKLRKANEHGEYLLRKANETYYHVPKVRPQVMAPYPWESKFEGKFPKITQEYLTCKGSHDNPIEILKVEGKEPRRSEDCGGHSSHSLPIKEGKEFVYPILIDLLNFLQDELEKPVEITCGHRCPDHNQYADSRPFNLTSKHQIGAEVDFYIIGLEHDPLTVIQKIQSYYLRERKYQKQQDYTVFHRYQKDNTDVSVHPWYNKEIFIKLYQKHEGRDKDNKHPYPYISIQVRHDFDREQSVHFNWDEAHKNYYRR